MINDLPTPSIPSPRPAARVRPAAHDPHRLAGPTAVRRASTRTPTDARFAANGTTKTDLVKGNGITPMASRNKDAVPPADAHERRESGRPPNRGCAHWGASVPRRSRPTVYSIRKVTHHIYPWRWHVPNTRPRQPTALLCSTLPGRRGALTPSRPLFIATTPERLTGQ